MGAGVAQAGQDVAVGDHVAQFAQVLAEQAQVEEGLAVGLQGPVEEDLHEALARRLHGPTEVLVDLLAVVGAVTGSEVIDRRELLPVIGAATLGGEGLAGRRIADGLEASGQVQLADLAPGLAAERQLGLQAEHEARTADLDDGGHVPFADHLVEEVGAAASRTLLGTDAPAEQDPGIRIAHGLQDLGRSAHQLHQSAPGADRPGDGDQLGDICEGTGDGPAVGRLVGLVTVGGEAEGAAVHGLGHDGAHLVQFLGRCLFREGPVAHDRVSDSAMSDQARDVDTGTDAVQGVEIAAIVLPGPGQARQDSLAGDVLHRLHHRRQQGPVSRLAGREGQAAIAEKRGGHAVPADWRQVRIPPDLGVEVGVKVDEARGDQQAGSVNLAPATRLNLADRRDQAPVDGDVRRPRRRTRAVHHGTAPDHQIMAHDLTPQTCSTRLAQISARTLKRNHEPKRSLSHMRYRSLKLS